MSLQFWREWRRWRHGAWTDATHARLADGCHGQQQQDDAGPTVWQLIGTFVVCPLLQIQEIQIFDQ